MNVDLTRIIGVLSMERDKRTTSRRRRKRLERLIEDLIELDLARLELHIIDRTKPPHPPLDASHRR